MLKKLYIYFSMVIFFSTLNADEILCTKYSSMFKALEKYMCIYVVTLGYCVQRWIGKDDIASTVCSNVYLGGPGFNANHGIGDSK